MARVRPARLRARIFEEPDGLRIIVPVERNFFVISYMSAMLLVVVLVFGLGLRDMSRSGVVAWPPLFFLIIGLIFLVCVGYPFLWNLLGREVTYIDPAVLVVRREILGMGRSQEFDLAEVREIRAHQHYIPVWWRMYPMGRNPGSISFDYGAKTYHFGENLDEAEAKIIVQTIKQRFPTVA